MMLLLDLYYLVNTLDFLKNTFTYFGCNTPITTHRGIMTTGSIKQEELPTLQTIS